MNLSIVAWPQAAREINQTWMPGSVCGLRQCIACLHSAHSYGNQQLGLKSKAIPSASTSKSGAPSPKKAKTTKDDGASTSTSKASTSTKSKTAVEKPVKNPVSSICSALMQACRQILMLWLLGTNCWASSYHQRRRTKDSGSHFCSLGWKIVSLPHLSLPFYTELMKDTIVDRRQLKMSLLKSIRSKC